VNILVDTGAWYAVADTSDRHHTEASRFYTEALEQHLLITTDLIVAETYTLDDVLGDLEGDSNSDIYRRVR